MNLGDLQTIFRAVLSTGLMVWAVSLCDNSYPGEENVCTNGSFEELSPAGFPVDWAPVGQTVTVSRDAYHGRYSLRLVRTAETKTAETGLNRGHRPGERRPSLIDRLKGGMQFAYKAVSVENAELRLYVIPVDAEYIERTGAPRATYVVPQEHVGDGKWHVARIAYDYTDNPKVKYVHFAARIVGTGGEILLDDFRYLEEAGPVITLGEITLDEDPDKPGYEGTLRVVVNNVGDRPAEGVVLRIEVPSGLTAEPEVHQLRNLEVKNPRAIRWRILGERGQPGKIRVVAQSRDLTGERSFALSPGLRIRNFGPVEPVAFPQDAISVGCQVENTGSIFLRNIEIRFGLGDQTRVRQIEELAPGGRTTIRVEFPPPHPVGEMPVWMEVAKLALDGAERLGSSVRIVPSIKIPAPSGRSLAEVSADWARVESQRLRLVFLREEKGFGPALLEVRDIKGSWQRVGWIPQLGRLALTRPDSSVTTAFEMILYANLPPLASVTDGSALLVLTSQFRDGTRFQWRFEIPREEELIGWSLEAVAGPDLALGALDGPMLYVRDRTEAIFPGLEWLVDDELSSDWLDIAKDHPDRVRYVPHPQKITIPAVAFSGSYGTLGFLWDLHQKWDGVRDRPACVFASPDQFANQQSHLVGLMLPGVPEFVPENARHAETPYPWKAGQKLSLSGWIWVSPDAQDPTAVIETYLRLVGLPPMRPIPRGSYEGEIAFSMQAYLHSLWDPKEQKWWTSKGGGIMSRLDRPAHFAADLLLAEWFAEDPILRQACRSRAELVAALLKIPARWDALRFPGRFDLAIAGPFRPAELLASRQEDGSWAFDADQRGTGPFEGKDYRQLGPHGAVEVGTCARRAYEVLRYARIAGDWEVYKQMLPTLELMEKFRVPRAAQVWEIPVHTPDVLAAADAVDAYLEAYRLSGEDRWLKNAVLWARRGLPFIYLWDDPEKPFLQGASIPVFGATWYRGSWFGRAVQWNGLRYAEALLRLADYDASLPWREIAERIVCSALYQQDAEGENVALWPDAISALDGRKVAWVFPPRQILGVILQLLGRDEEPRTVFVGQPPNELRITTRARISDLDWQGGRLVFRAEFPPGDQGCILVTGISRPTDVLFDGQPTPEVPQVEQSNEPAWRYDSAYAYLVIRVPTDRAVTIEVVPAEYEPRERVPRLAQEISFEFEQSPEGWLPAHHVGDLQVVGGRLQGTIIGGDPYIIRPIMRVPAERYRNIHIRMYTTAGQVAQLFWTTAESPNFDEAKSLHFRVTSQREFSEYELAVGNHPLWRGTITALRLDPGGGTPSGEFAVEYIRGE